MTENLLTEYFLDAIKDFEMVRGEAIKIHDRIIQQFKWAPNGDLRISVFEQLDNLIRPLSLSLTLLVMGFRNPNLIHNLYFKNMAVAKEQEKVDIERIKIHLANFHKLAFLYGLSQVVEGNIRSILRALDANDRATDGFGKICERLAEKLQQPLYLLEARKGLDLLREIRNTIHNNGIYWAKYGVRTKVIEYQGDRFVFEDGKAHNNATFKVLSRITLDIIIMFNELVTEPNIHDLPTVSGPTIA